MDRCQLASWGPVTTAPESLTLLSCGTQGPSPPPQPPHGQGSCCGEAVGPRRHERQGAIYSSSFNLPVKERTAEVTSNYFSKDINTINLICFIFGSLGAGAEIGLSLAINSGVTLVLQRWAPHGAGSSLAEHRLQALGRPVAAACGLSHVARGHRRGGTRCGAASGHGHTVVWHTQA